MWPIITYCLGLFVVVYSKQCGLQARPVSLATFLQNFISIMLYHFWVTGFNLKRRWTKLPIIAPYIYDARYHAHPYIIIKNLKQRWHHIHFCLAWIYTILARAYYSLKNIASLFSRNAVDETLSWQPTGCAIIMLGFIWVYILYQSTQTQLADLSLQSTGFSDILFSHYTLIL